MSMPARLAKPVKVYQIKVTLRGSHPPIWRRIQMRCDITLAKLHRILQCVMGWEDAHLHQFAIGDQTSACPARTTQARAKAETNGNTKLSEVVPGERSQFRYDYDFGDNWQHVLVVEKILPPEEGVRYPVCLAGARACPPEDVGGLPGYENFLEAIGDPGHPEHNEFSEWVGGTFDSEALDGDEVNQRL